MYSIGEFSQINRVTTKTLRHYDELGLLKPDHIDKFTGYRYYSSSQLPYMHKILALKLMGFTLTEIIALLDSNCSGETMKNLLEIKRRETLATVSAGKHRLLIIENFLSTEKGDFMNNYTVAIKELPEVIVASYRTILKTYRDLMEIVPTTVYNEMVRLNCK